MAEETVDIVIGGGWLRPEPDVTAAATAPISKGIDTVGIHRARNNFV